LVGETLLSSFGFKFRSVVNLLVSVYAVAVTVSFWDYGSSGIENVASALVECPRFLGPGDLSVVH
jgi:hypothetical protein